jgi:hypothetical protein
MPNEDTCFVISPIGESDSETRSRSDKLLNYVIEPPVREHGYDPVRADQIDEPGIITNHVIEYVVESPIVIADLTGSNANVFYELAIRHTIEKPFIQLIDENQTIPFDVAATRTIMIDLEDLESVESAKEEISDQISNIETDSTGIDSPISVAMNVRNLKESSDPDERSIGEMMEAITEVRKDVSSIENKLNEPSNILPEWYIKETSHDISSKNSVEAANRLEHTHTRLTEILKEINQKETHNLNKGKILTDLADIRENIDNIKYMLNHPAEPPQNPDNL